MFERFFKSEEKSHDPVLDFWNWFSKNEASFRKALQNQTDIEGDFLEPIKSKLEPINEQIFFLAGIKDDTYELIFTPDGILSTVVYVEALVAAAPSLPHWEFIALKPPTPASSEFGIKMYDQDFKIHDLYFYPIEDQTYPDTINIAVICKLIEDSNKELYSNPVYILLENFIGEANLMTIIDHIEIINGSEIDSDLHVPLVKLPDYLKWRQKEFIEKYEGIRHDIDEDTYSVLEFENENGNAVAIINSDLMKWDRKASHPWLLVLSMEIPADTSEATWTWLDDIEVEVNSLLPSIEGYLNIGRRTSNHTREIIWANKDFRLPAKVIDAFIKKYESKITMRYDLYKDKYWQSLEVFNV